MVVTTSMFASMFGQTGVLIAIVLGGLVGLLLYVVGVIVAAQGQMLKATLDSAVNSSPFLTHEHKAEIMSL